MVNRTDQMTHSELAKKRKRAEITGAKLAEELGVDPASVSRFERYGMPLPKGLEERDYEDALDRLIKADKSK